jgi:Ca2+-binding EF-hand superfamily protein
LTLILPSSSASLRHISQELIITKEPQLNYESLWSLIKVFEKILENQSKIEKNLCLIKDRYDYNDFEAFRSIDIENLGYIDADAIFNFFNKNKETISDNEILLIFRKADKDQDAKINLKEFEDEMNNRGVYRLNKTLLKSPMKSFLKTNRLLSSAKKKENSSYNETRTSSKYSKKIDGSEREACNSFKN